jgi:hypothetical protein
MPRQQAKHGKLAAATAPTWADEVIGTYTAAGADLVRRERFCRMRGMGLQAARLRRANLQQPRASRPGEPHRASPVFAAGSPPEQAPPQRR